MNDKELTCIVCPMSCRITVRIEEMDGVKTVSSVTGNGCARGLKYAMQEAVRPMRVLTGNVMPKGRSTPLSVRTTAPVPKDMLLACAAHLKTLHPELPVRTGDIIEKDILGTGADVAATADMA